MKRLFAFLVGVGSIFAMMYFFFTDVPPETQGRATVMTFAVISIAILTIVVIGYLSGDRKHGRIQEVPKEDEGSGVDAW